MVFSAEERLMYEVMKAVYDSGIPISFKGSMVLKACLIEAGFSDDIRHTVDIDGNWHSDTPPSGEQMKASLQKALAEYGIDLSVSLYRMYGVGRSAGFELTDNATGEVLFTMDVDVNRPEAPTRLYELEGIRFQGASPLKMTADKLSAVSSEKVFRRIKDVVDLYYMSKVFELDREAVLKVLKDTGRELGSFDGFLHRKGELQHAYEKFRFSGDVNKPSFEEVYETVKAYIWGDNAMDKENPERYAAQAKERWGDTDAYKAFEQKSHGRSREEDASLAEQMMDIFAEFGAIRDEDPAAAAAQEMVKKLQAFITNHYYTCTKEILGGLGQMYGSDGEFGRNIDKAGGEGTATFVSKAIEAFCYS